MRDVRVQVEGCARVQLDDGDAALASIRNLSMHGVQLSHLEKALKVGSDLILCCSIGDVYFETPAEVVWQHDDAVGLRFLYPSDTGLRCGLVQAMKQGRVLRR